MAENLRGKWFGFGSKKRVSSCLKRRRETWNWLNRKARELKRKKEY